MDVGVQAFALIIKITIAITNTQLSATHTINCLYIHYYFRSEESTIDSIVTGLLAHIYASLA